MHDQGTKSREHKGVLRRLMEMSDRLSDEVVQRRPSRFTANPDDVLTVEQVAVVLRCSVDQARRIPRTELPAYRGPGKYVLFFREDVLSYLRSRPRKNESMANNAAMKVRRGRNANALQDNVHSFDPDDIIARLPGRER